MLKIIKNQDSAGLNISLVGRLDTMTSPILEGELKDALDQVRQLTLEMSKLEYISSSGLRILLQLQKRVNSNGGKMLLRHVTPEIREVLNVTGSSGVLTII